MNALDVVEIVEERKARAKRRLPRGRVTVFPNWCKGCGLCVEFCPAGVLEHGLDGPVVLAHPERCTACRWCELHCPDFAIFVTDIEPEEEAE
ncbi:MAG: 4Fe-4S dicluster domain-containing protein [Dehalococcoidia bacterium]|nr:MAG: 4Fe-4S dicluster domain-containing protein [Dehalococcoidia bacterium]